MDNLIGKVKNKIIDEMSKTVSKIEITEKILDFNILDILSISNEQQFNFLNILIYDNVFTNGDLSQLYINKSKNKNNINISDFYGAQVDVIPATIILNMEEPQLSQCKIFLFCKLLSLGENVLSMIENNHTIKLPTENYTTYNNLSKLYNDYLFLKPNSRNTLYF